MTAQNFRRTQTKHGISKKGRGWTNWRGLIKKGLHLAKFEKRWPFFFKFISFYIKMSFTQVENHHSVVMWPLAIFANETVALNFTLRAHN